MSVLRQLSVLVVFVVIDAIAGHQLLTDLLSASEHETHLNDEIARLLDIDYERQGACGSDVTEQCCVSCAYNGACHNGGFCCELSKIRTKILKSEETDCPVSWRSECRLTKLLPIESDCGLSGHKGNRGIPKGRHSSESDSSADSDERMAVEKTGVRLMCLCLRVTQCCSSIATPAMDTPTTTAASTPSTTTSTTTAATTVAWTTPTMTTTTVFATPTTTTPRATTVAWTTPTTTVFATPTTTTPRATTAAWTTPTMTTTTVSTTATATAPRTTTVSWTTTTPTTTATTTVA